ncbi:helix-turn-helix transcriptional regulator [Oceanobacillus profundus]|uniref:helix-turn-helix transcriptional regulator n=2 Tax=Oceanobacillus TaxID=182709 RepID=UPI00362F9CE6
MATILYISKTPFSKLILQKIEEQTEMELIGCVLYTTNGLDIEEQPNVVLLDTESIALPEVTAAIKQLKAANPFVKVITIVGASQLDDSMAIIEAGSDSVIEKRPNFEDKLMLVILIQDAHYYAPSSVILDLLERLDELKKDNFDLFRKRLGENGIHISMKESLVAYFLKKNLRNNEIAECIQLREGTVKVHISQIYKKINIRGRKNVVHYLNKIMSNRVRMEEASPLN